MNKSSTSIPYILRGSSVFGVDKIETPELDQQLHKILSKNLTFPHLVIAFSGIDGSGKSTQLRFLNDWLHASGLPTFPTEVEVHGFVIIRELAKKLTGDKLAYHAVLPATLHELVWASDVGANYFKVIKPHLNTGKIILCDRSTLCHRVYARAYGADLTWIEQIYDMIPPPDITFLFDVPSDISNQRLQKRIEKPLATDENPVFLKKVRELYLELSRQEDNVHVIDASLTIEEIQKQVREQFIRKLASLP
jgi:dTMP kinase